MYTIPINMNTVSISLNNLAARKQSRVWMTLTLYFQMTPYNRNHISNKRQKGYDKEKRPSPKLSYPYLFFRS